MCVGHKKEKQRCFQANTGGERYIGLPEKIIVTGRLQALLARKVKDAIVQGAIIVIHIFLLLHLV